MDDPSRLWIFLYLFSTFAELITSAFVFAEREQTESDIEVHEKTHPHYYRAARNYLLHPGRLIKAYGGVSTGLFPLAGISVYFLGRNAFAGNRFEILFTVLLMIGLLMLYTAFSVITPYYVGGKKHESAAPGFFVPFRIIEAVFIVFIEVINLLALLFSSVFGVNIREDSEDVTEEDVLSMVQAGHEKGVFLGTEAEMIQNIFEFDDKIAKDIMTHRNDIEALDGEILLREAIRVMVDTRYSRIPVYVGDLDNIIGILHIKDVLAYSSDESNLSRKIRDIDSLLQKAESVPETHGINTLFTQMQFDKMHMVIVTDEYGQTSGLISMEDILEEIVGNIQDEHDDDEEQMVRLSEKSYAMDGLTPLEEVGETLDLDFSDLDFETLNGFLINEIDRIPEDHEAFDVHARGYIFHVCGVKDGVIGKVKVRREDGGDIGIGEKEE